MNPWRHPLGAVSIALALAGVATTSNVRAEVRHDVPRAEARHDFDGWTPLSDYVRAGLAEGGSFRLTVPTKSGPVEVALRPVPVRGAGYHAQEASGDGARRGRKAPALRAFAGSVALPGAPAASAAPARGGDFARLAQGPDGRVAGLLRVDGVLYDLAADPAAGDLVLAVHEMDPHEIGALLGSCGAAVDEALAGTLPAEVSGDGGGTPGTAAAGTLREIELGTEADAPFVTQTGGVAEANAKILSIVNAINGIYEADLGLTLEVVFQRAWNGSDPYTSSDSSTLLTQFGSSFLSGVSTPTDEAQLFSGRDFESNVVGRAWLSSACTSNRFGVNQYYQQSESLTRLIVAHEMGHNLGGNHTADGIMAASINSSVTWFSAASQNEIGGFVDGLGCLAEVAAGGPPVLDPIGPQTVSENTTLSLSLSASDPDGDPIEWSASPLPEGATLSSGGQFSWKPPRDSVGCGGFVDVAVTFEASDPDGHTANETVVISVLDAPTGAPPAFSKPANRSALVGHGLTIPLAAVDADGDSVSFGATSLPAGAALSPSGVFTWSPSEAQLGSHEIDFTATDCTGASSAQSLTLDVVPDAPLLAGLSAGSGVKGDEITITGQHFAGRKVRVYFGEKRRKPLSVTDGEIVVRVPKLGRTPVDVSISVFRDGIASQNILPFSYVLPAP